MGNQPNAQSAQLPQESTAQQLLAYTQNLPALLQTTANQVQPVGQTLQNAQQSLAPQAQGLQNQLYQGYAPGLYQTGNLLNAINTAGGINTASSALSGTGGQLLNQAIGANQQANPYFYQAAGAAAPQLSSLLSSYNPTGQLSGSQVQQVNSGLAQQDAMKGILNAPSQTSAIRNLFLDSYK